MFCLKGGITEEGNKSTSSKYKPGDTYFSPSLKIHKCDPKDLIPGCDVPARLITCLQDGVTKRSDVYIAEKWLMNLQRDYCEDLVEDTNDTLRWLEKLNSKGKATGKNFTPFTFDFDSLYDSISPSLVFKALEDAMNTCRPNWEPSFKDWLLELVDLSIESAVGIFRGKFYKPKGKLPTGGSLSVPAANIAVYFVLCKVLYSDKTLMKDVIAIKRFIDDGVGIHTMTKRVFNGWKKEVSKRVATFGLKIKESDWSEPPTRFGSVNFLDILFSFDENKRLQTDLYRKPTDARAYLNFSSCHPNHVFAGSVYSQALRMRRIINNDERFEKRLDELMCDFEKSGYPKNMLLNIMEKVKKEKRTLCKKEKCENSDEDGKIMAVSTSGRDKKLTNILERVQTKSKYIKFKLVKKTAPSLKNLLVKSKRVALGSPYGRTTKCGRKNCMGCKLMSNRDSIRGANKKLYKTAKGDCTNRNVIYHAKCVFCSKKYVGKTITPLSTRLNGHRNKFYDCIRVAEGKNIEFTDEHLLGLHLFYDHKMRDPRDFNEGYRFTILENSNPRQINYREHVWILRLRCIAPYGLNAHDPYGIPLVL